MAQIILFEETFYESCLAALSAPTNRRGMTEPLNSPLPLVRVSNVRSPCWSSVTTGHRGLDEWPSPDVRGFVNHCVHNFGQ